MAVTILGVIVVFLLPVAIGWRIALDLLQGEGDPTPQLKLFFWVMSALFIVLAGAAFLATRYIE